MADAREERACQSCAYESQGECRRRAPVAVPVPMATVDHGSGARFNVDLSAGWETLWPTVRADDWCGDFVAKEAPDA